MIVGPGETLRLEASEAGVRLEAALDGGPLKPAGQTFTAPRAGDHWLAVAGRDGAGNLSPIRWIRLRVDGEPPRVELGTEPPPVAGDRRWMPPAAEVSASAEDSLAGVVRVFLAVGDDVRETSEGSASAALPLEGEVIVRAWAIDRAGNQSAEATLELAVDSTPPAGKIRAGCPTAAGAEAVVVALGCPIGVEVDDGESGVARWSLLIDGEEAAREALAGPWTAGAHTVAVDAVDAVGNQGRIGPFVFTADGAGPEIAWRVEPGVTGAGGETFHLPPVVVTVEASDSPAGFDRLSSSIDGESYLPVDGLVAVEGDRLWLRATDRVGNVSSVEASWRLDLAPPEIRLLAAGGGVAAASDGVAAASDGVAGGGTVEIQRGGAVRFETIDQGAGVERSTYSLRVESAHIGRRWWWWPPAGEPLPEELVFPWPGELTLEVESFDRLGNRSAARWRVVVRSSKGGGS